MAISGIEQDAIIERLDRIIRQTVPDVETLPKYGGTLYTLRPSEKEGQFCGIFPYKDHVQLAFSNGTALEDPNHVLSGTGKFRRHINFSDLQAIAPETLAELIVNAVQYSRSQDAESLK
ncbi:hypothetical protein DI396_12655 [Litorivita pollutaquae]|uniref:YdhG-like domain-containing protein n=1 Tax=Litorivita pollutaquae TaxID=2200892 RepID=A0A2V4NL97_9RHOB|nr:DUF1801 domain-containing protein [Litorivita pollutaquae]PYC47057.1 hypothetical protein DI396_12655 [Litorivita pollutaquae]